MRSVFDRLKALGTLVPEVLLPAAGTDLEAWAVIACDQFTQDREYWKRVNERAGSAPSTLRMILPEVFLEDGDRPERVSGIRKSMYSYLGDGIFAPPVRALVYIERATPHHPLRRGLVLAIDLERYEWQSASRPLIRATEGTVKERLPPRMEIRRGAPIEVPHVLLLVDDDERKLIEGLGVRAKNRKPAYSTALMLGAGSISGWLVDSMDDLDYFAACLERLASKARTRYGHADGAADENQADPFLYAVGDGNHSLATAKAVWDEYKAAHGTDPRLMEHPSRWALVEVENLYDEGIEFEPIHRALFGTTADEVIGALSELPGCTSCAITSATELEHLVGDVKADKTRFGLIAADRRILVETSAAGLSTDALQPILDRFTAAKPGRSIDYLHGAAETIRVGSAPGVVGILLPPIGKSDLFATVARSGPLPRKSFSMGEAIEKRFYLECRKLFG
ncbi:MAG: DUF1015 domain-containing protein [Treponemataceae bacterium]